MTSSLQFPISNFQITNKFQCQSFKFQNLGFDICNLELTSKGGQ